MAEKSFMDMFTPAGVGATVQYGIGIWQAAEAKSATAIQAWDKWEADTVQAIRQATQLEKQNYRAYNVDLENWYKQSDYVEKLRQYESALEKQAAETKTATSQSALRSLGRQLADREVRFYEEEAAATIQLENIRLKNIADSVKRVASGQVGRTIQGIGTAYHQQWLTNASNRQITRQFRIGDKLAAANAAVIDAQNKTNSVALYNPRPYADPVQPLAPIPVDTYLPKEPKVSGTLSILDIASTAMGAYQSYVDMSPPKGDTQKAPGNTPDTSKPAATTGGTSTTLTTAAPEEK